MTPHAAYQQMMHVYYHVAIPVGAFIDCWVTFWIVRSWRRRGRDS
jgi:hypothetical protein